MKKRYSDVTLGYKIPLFKCVNFNEYIEHLKTQDKDTIRASSVYNDNKIDLFLTKCFMLLDICAIVCSIALYTLLHFVYTRRYSTPLPNSVSIFFLFSLIVLTLFGGFVVKRYKDKHFLLTVQKYYLNKLDNVSDTMNDTLQENPKEVDENTTE